ncbi:MAG: 5'-nucleotidase C-terminal domain-containing protein [Dongiaceae bacterium]
MQHRRLRRLGLVAALAAFVVLAGPAAAGSRITFLQFNDFYELRPKAGLGGAAELATLLDRERAAHPGAVTVVSGDFLSPSILSGATKGAPMIDIFNAMGVDLVVAGNHEFDFGLPVTDERIGQSRFAWVASNLHDLAGKPLPGTQPQLIREIGGVKVGFLGLTTPETETASSGGAELRIEPPIEAARRAVSALQAAGAQLIVAITHQTIEEDRALAAAVPEIRLILGGHEHIPITWYERGTLIQKSGTDGQFLAVVELEVEGSGAKMVVTPSWRMIANRSTPPEPKVAALVGRYTDQLDAVLKVEIGRSTVALDSRTEVVREQESSMGDLVADALRAALGADVALTNGGGLRGNTVLPAGAPITRGTILAELPFGNLAMLVELSGAELKAALENGVSQAGTPAGRFPQVSGLAFRYDPKRRPGDRVTTVTVGGKPLDPAARYRLATNDFMVKGGDGYAMLARGKPLNDPRFAPLLASVVIDYVAAHSPVSPAVGGRIVAE